MHDSPHVIVPGTYPHICLPKHTHAHTQVQTEGVQQAQLHQQTFLVGEHCEARKHGAAFKCVDGEQPVGLCLLLQFTAR